MILLRIENSTLSIRVLRNKHQVVVIKLWNFVNHKILIFKCNQIIGEYDFCVLLIHTCNFDKKFEEFLPNQIVIYKLNQN